MLTFNSYFGAFMQIYKYSCAQDQHNFQKRIFCHFDRCAYSNLTLSRVGGFRRYTHKRRWSYND